MMLTIEIGYLYHDWNKLFNWAFSPVYNSRSNGLLCSVLIQPVTGVHKIYFSDGSYKGGFSALSDAYVCAFLYTQTKALCWWEMALTSEEQTGPVFLQAHTWIETVFSMFLCASSRNSKWLRPVSVRTFYLQHASIHFLLRSGGFINFGHRALLYQRDNAKKDGCIVSNLW